MWPFDRKTTVKARDKPAQPKVRAAGGGYRPIRRLRADRTLTGYEAIYAAVSRIANTMASMPLHLYSGQTIQSEDAREKMISFAPNPNMTPFAFVQTMECIRNTEGTAYALIVPNRTTWEPERLDILDPTQVQPMIDPETGEHWYRIQLDETTYLLPGCMLIILRWMSANGTVGVSPVSVLKDSLGFDAAVKEIALEKLDGVNQGVFLKVPSTVMDDDAKDNLINSFLDTYEKSNHQVILLEGGMEATPFNQSGVDAQLLDVERITRNRVATVYNIPPHMLGDYTDTSFSTAEQQMQEFLTLTIAPIAAQWEQEFNRKLLTAEQFAEGYRFVFDFNALLRADMKTTAEVHQMSIRSGWQTINEVRLRQGLPPDPDGDVLLISRDLIPITVPVKHPEMLLGSAPAGDGE